MSESRSNELLDLPDMILNNIMLNLSYDEIAQKRIVCKKFDSINKEILNEEYQLLKSHIEKYITDVKSTLPCRDSGKEGHPRYRHFGVLNTLKLNLNCLIRTYGQYMNEDLCCFISGKVMDEAILILNLIKEVEILTKPPYKITKKFRKMVDMAQEHFKEVVEPPLKNILNARNAIKLENSLSEIGSSDSTLKACLSTIEYEPSQTFSKFNFRIKRNKIAVLCMKGQIGKIKSRLRKQTHKMHELNKRLECVEQKLNCPKEVEKQNTLESYERILSHIKFICESNFAGISNAGDQRLTAGKESNFEKKIDRLA